MIGQQNTDSLECRLFFLLDNRRGKCHLERGSLSRAAADGNGSLHHIHQPFCDAHPETASLNLVCPAVLLAGERFKYMFKELRTHSRAGIRNGKYKRSSVLLLHFKDDPPRHRCKFAGVGQQIQQDLAKTECITVKLLILQVHQMNVEDLSLLADSGQRNHNHFS